MPTSPVKPKKSIILLLSIIIGFIIGVAIAFLRDYFDDLIKTIEDVEQATDIPVYGVIPTINHKAKENIDYEESLRVIRTNLEFLSSKTTSKLITVTSSIPSEGKTTTISELGKIISKSHKSVILVDLDMRKARVHEQFNLSNEKGMSTLLTNKHKIRDVIQHTDQTDLDIITAGPIPPNPSELIMSKQTTIIITKLLEHYDYVLVDTPPIGLVTDAMMILKISDINLFISRANFTKKELVKNLTKITKMHHLNTSGMILNDVILDKQKGYGYGYGYGYRS